MTGPYIAGLIALCLALALPITAIWARLAIPGIFTDEYGPNGLGVFAAIAAVMGVVFVPILAAANWPLFDLSYHRNTSHTLTVASVDSRLIDRTDQYAITGPDGTILKCTDTRCATIRPGDTVTLICLKQWQRYGTPGYDCSFVSLRKAGAR